MLDGQPGAGENSPARKEEINRISRKLATLEMKVSSHLVCGMEDELQQHGR